MKLERNVAQREANMLLVGEREWLEEGVQLCLWDSRNLQLIMHRL